MSVETIPKSFQYKCDVLYCKETHLQVGEIHNGHYINSTPPEWRTMRWVNEGNGWREMLLCPKHRDLHDTFLRDELSYEEPPKAAP